MSEVTKTTEMGDETTIVKSKKNKLTAVIIASVLIAAVIIAAVLVVRVTSPARRLQNQLDLGARYLSELDYGQAIAAYQAAIEIDPKNPDAYLGLSEAYLGLGDTDSVIRTLTEGYGETGDEEIADTLIETGIQYATDEVEAGNYDRALETLQNTNNIVGSAEVSDQIAKIEAMKNEMEEQERLAAAEEARRAGEAAAAAAAAELQEAQREKYEQAEQALSEGNYVDAKKILDTIPNYEGSQELLEQAEQMWEEEFDRIREYLTSLHQDESDEYAFFVGRLGTSFLYTATNWANNVIPKEYEEMWAVSHNYGGGAYGFIGHYYYVNYVDKTVRKFRYVDGFNDDYTLEPVGLTVDEAVDGDVLSYRADNNGNSDEGDDGQKSQ